MISHSPSFLPGIPNDACKIFIPKLCNTLIEPNYFDINCYSRDDVYGNLGCNAGGTICCRFCEFGHYKNISCIKSPSLPPLPYFPPKSPHYPPISPSPNFPPSPNIFGLGPTHSSKFIFLVFHYNIYIYILF